MAPHKLLHVPEKIRSGLRPVITSYDSGYEHSLEHMIEVQRLVAEAAQEIHEPRAVKSTEAALPAQASGF